MRKIFPLLRSTALIASLISLSISSALSQQAAPAQESGFQMPFANNSKTVGLFKWDASQQMLLFHRDVQANIEAVRAFSLDGLAQPPIFPLSDFPEQDKAWVYDVTAIPSRGVAMAVTFQKGKHDLTYRILSYDRDAKLRKVWNMYPYHHVLVAADTDGNIYAFGDRADVSDPSSVPDYPVLIKYSARGKVLKEFLHRGDFPLDAEFSKDFPLMPQNKGQHFLLLTKDLLVFYFATTGELFEFNFEGKLLRRVNISSRLDELNRQFQSSDAQIFSLVDADDYFLAQIRLLPKAAQSYSTVLMNLTHDGSSWTQSGPMMSPPAPGFLLGVGADGGRMFLKYNDGALSLARYSATP